MKITANVAALLDETPNEAVRKPPHDQKPYWDLERARIGNSRKVPVELIVNGQAVARQEIDADGGCVPSPSITTSRKAAGSRCGFCRLRIRNPIFVLTEGKPIRASRKSAEWCLESSGSVLEPEGNEDPAEGKR